MKQYRYTTIKDLTQPLRRGHLQNIPSDVQGSYTGMAEDDGHPVQDADDI